MNKHLVRTEEEYIRLFKDFELNDAEDFLGVEFAYADGSYQSDMWNGLEVNENQSVDYNTYRKLDINNFPQFYPCIVLLANEKDWDRTGNIYFKMLEFVYPEDFK